MALLIATMDNTVVNVALPTIQRTMKASSSELQWVVDAYVLVLASLLLNSGSLGDRYGRRKIFHLGLGIFAIGSFACSMAPSLEMLIGFRALQGVGGSMLTPSTLSIVSNVYTEPRERAKAIGIWSATSGLSIGLGPVIGGALVQAIGWPAVFWINLPFCAIAVLGSRRYVPESRAERRRRLDWPGQILATACLATLTYTLIEAPSAGWASTQTLALLATAALLASTFLLVERKRQDPLLNVGYFRSPPFTASIVVAFAAFLSFFAFVFVNTLYLQEVLGNSALMAGVLTLPATGLIVFAAPLSGRLTAARGPRIPTTVACLFIGAGLFLLVQAQVSSPYWHLAVGYLGIGIGIGLVNPPVTNAAVSGMPNQEAGVAAATASTARQVGGVFGVALIGSIVFTRFRSGLGRTAHQFIGAHSAQSSLELTQLPHSLRVNANAAFTSAMHIGYLVAAVLIIVTAGMAGLAIRRTSR